MRSWRRDRRVAMSDLTQQLILLRLDTSFPGGSAGLLTSRSFPLRLDGRGTGLIGDPTGKTLERPLLDEEEVEANIQGQLGIIRTLFGRAVPASRLLTIGIGWAALGSWRLCVGLGAT